MNRPRLSGFVFLVLCAISTLLLLYPAATATAARNGIQAAWDRARESGAYHFSADIVQVTHPLPTVTNVGRQSKRDALHIEGRTDLPARALNFTLWSNGGSVAGNAGGVEIRVTGDRAQARTDMGRWEEIDNFSGLFAPSGDFMAYLAATQNVVHLGEETRAGRTFTRYGFDINGKRYAAYMRDQIERQMAERGELPPGVELDMPEAYRNMTGQGELWVNQDGLPMRQVLNLAFPKKSDSQTEAQISVTFSEFAKPAAKDLTLSTFVPSRRTLQKLAFFATTVAFVVVLIAYRHSKKLYAAVVIGLSLSMIVTPLLQSVQAADFAARQAARAAEREQDAQESEMARTVRTLEEKTPSAASPAALAAIESDSGLDSDRDGHTDVEEMLLGTNPRRAEERTVGDSALSAALQQTSEDDGTDTDGDGLTDYVEGLIGTSPDLADTDGDLLTDLEEVEGFEYGSHNGTPRHWYTDPLEEDTNGDGFGDGTEWDANDDGQVDDTDGDEIPDIFDEDNDGDGVADKTDLSPYQRSPSTFDFANPFAMVLENLDADKPTYVEFQLRPTTDTHLWYAYNVLDWPADRKGQIQDGDDATFWDVNQPEELLPHDNGDVKLVPMLQIRISGDPTNLPPTAELKRYGISVFDLTDDGEDKAVYIPLQLVTEDQGGERVAFYAKMLYQPADWWGDEQTVRVVWMVNGLVDRCEEFEDGECVAYAETNQEQPIFTYTDEEWYLTGFNVREDHGVDTAQIYEDPAEDPNLHDDESLLLLAGGLQDSFLAGRTGEDGERDLTIGEIYRRFNHATNTAVTDDERWQIPNILSVVTRTYSHQDEALMTLAMTETPAILTNTFTAYWEIAPITPTLMVAREERARALNLDELYADNPLLEWDGRQLTVDLDPDEVKVQVMACLNWAPYFYDGDAEVWDALDIEIYWQELERRYADDFDDPDPDVALGALTMAQIAYVVLYRGLVNTVQTGDIVLERNYQSSDKPLGASIITGVGAAIKFVVNKIIMRGFYNISLAHKILGTLMSQQRFHRLGVATPMESAARLFKRFKGWWKAQSLRAQGALAITAIAVIALLVVGLIELGKAFVAGNPGVRIAVAVVVGVVMFAMTVVVPLLKLADFVRVTQSVYNISRTAALAKALTAKSEIVGTSSKAGIVGLIIAVAVTWGVFIYAVATSDVPFWSVGFNELLAQTIAATIVAVIMFVLSTTVVGAIIVAIIALVDIILTIIGLDFTITGWVTETVAKALYHFELMVDTDVDMGGIDLDLTEPDEGMMDGNTIEVTANITTTATFTDPGDPRLYPYLPIHYTKGVIRNTTFEYGLSTSAYSQTAESGTMNGRWTVEDHHRFLGKQLYRAWSTDAPSTYNTLNKGINSTLLVWLNTGYDLPGVECWTVPVPPLWGWTSVPVCYRKYIDGSTSTEIGDSIHLDVFPRTLDEFYALTWAGVHEFEFQRDHDGDGLINPYFDGIDPNDEAWDSDGDGLSDRYELEMRAGAAVDGGERLNALDPYTDNDDLRDDQEIFFATDPASRDTDGDGLDDDEEVYHQDLTDVDNDGDTKEWLGGWVVTHTYTDTQDQVHTLNFHVTSSPISADIDGDGMSDLAERTLNQLAPDDYAFSPVVWNESPVGIYAELSDEDAIVKPGDSFIYTSTVENNLTIPLFVMGTMTNAIPARLGSTPIITRDFNVFREETAALSTTLTAQAGDSVSVTLHSAMFGNLHDGDVRIKWRWDPAHKSNAATTGGWPWYSAIAPANEALNPGYAYAVATVEGDSQRSPFSNRYINQTANTAVNLRYATEVFGQPNRGDPDPRPPSAGTRVTPPGVACGEDTGRCLMTWADSQFHPCTSVYFDRLYCHEEKDGPGSHAEFYLQLNGSKFWGNSSTATGETETINITKGFCNIAHVDLWESDGLLNDDDHGGTTSINALAPGSGSHRFTGGDASVYWYVNASHNDKLEAAIFSPNGTRQCRRTLEDDYHGAVESLYYSTPVVASDGTDYLLVWRHGGSHLRAQAMPNDCNAGLPMPQDVSGTSGSSTEPELVWNGSDYLLFWQQHINTTDDDIKLVHLNSDGTSAGSVQNVANAAYEERGPSAAYNPETGQVLVVYLAEASQASVRGRFITGDTIGSEFTIATIPAGQTAHTPEVAYEPTHGGWMVSWPEFGGSQQLRYRPLHADGSAMLTEDESDLEGNAPIANGASSHDLSCRLGAPDQSTGECAAVVNPIEPIYGTNPQRITLEQMFLYRVLPWLGAFNQSDSLDVTIDADGPTSAFTSLSDGQYITATGQLVIGGSASDNTFVSLVWVSEDNGSTWHLANGAETWSYAWDTTGLPDGPHTLQVYAQDVAGNDGTVSEITVNLDRRPPQTTSTTPDEGTFDILAATQDGAGNWRIGLAGTVNDPPAGTQPGSGVASVQALVSPNGSGWQTATLAGNTWAQDYTLPGFDAEGHALANPTGFYTLSLRATDQLDNATKPQNYHQVLFGIDNTPPVASLTDPGMAITRTLDVSGGITDPAPVAAGVQGLEIAIGPSDEPPSGWTAVDTLDTPGAVNSGWSHQIPAGLEGMYRIDLRGTDTLNNRNDDQITWQKWNGEIDTLSPRAAITMTYRGAGSAAQTVYQGWARDFNLTEDEFLFPCPVQAVDRHYYGSDWWNSVTTETTRLFELTPTCVVNGFVEPAPGMRACDGYGHCTTVTATLPGGYVSPTVASTVLTPAHEAVLTTLDPVTLTVSAHAIDSLRTLTVTVSDGSRHVKSWPTTGTVDTLWQVPWSPLGEGVYGIVSVAKDQNGVVQTALQPISVTVDVQAPSVSIHTTVPTTTHRLSYGRVMVTGTVSDSVGVEWVKASTDTVTWNDAAVHGNTWRYAWNIGGEPDNKNFTLYVQAADRARITPNSAMLTVDLVEPEAMTVTTAYTGSLGSGVLEDSDTIRESNPTLNIDWTASADGSGLDRYLVGWTADDEPAPGALTSYAPTAPRHHEMVAGEAERWYAHVIARDNRGNTQRELRGPVYVDAPTTPDYVAELDYRGWMESGFTQIGADYEFGRQATGSAALTGTQKLYMSWHTDTLRLTWVGANWNTAGDLFVYLDTAAGGATTAYDPFGAGPTITLPAQGGRQLRANYLLWVQSGALAQLIPWDGAQWDLSVATDLDEAHYQIDRSLQPPHTDLLVPFGWMGITNPGANPLKLVALASEPDALRLWAAAPDKNPLNSERVVNPVAIDLLDQDFALTQQYEWPGLGVGQSPNQGQFADADLHAQLTAEPLGVEVGFLEHDLPSLLTPGAWLDADQDGALDQSLPVDNQSVLLGSGLTVTYTVRYANAGQAPATGVRITVTKQGALDLPGGGDTRTFDVGAVPAGTSGTRTFTATVNATDDSAEVRAVVADGVHQAFDWLWVQHQVDIAPPQATAIDWPTAYVRPYSNTIRGTVSDPSGVPTVKLEVRPTGGGAASSATCTDPTPLDGEWACPWNFGGAADGSQFDLRVQATDRFGNVGTWTPWRTVTVDDVPPQIRLDAETQDALSDSLLVPAELSLAGVVDDFDRQARAADVCVTPVGGAVEDASCRRIDVAPGDAITGTWRADAPVLDTGDGSWQTLLFYGVDGAGNRSTVPLTQNVQVDIVAPVITITIAEKGAAQGQLLTVLAGSISDGYGVNRVNIRVTRPDGNASWITPTLIGGLWNYTTRFQTIGHYTLGVDGWDDAGNRRHLGPFGLTILEGDFIADLTLSNTPSSYPAVTGSPLTYTLAVHNRGTSDATGTVLTTTLPQKVALLDMQPSQGSCEAGGRAVTCTLGTVTDATTATVALRVDVPLTTTGKLTCTAGVASNKIDFREEDNSSVLYVDTFQPVSGLTAHSDQPTALDFATHFSATIATGSDVAYLWAFGDGMTATGQTVSYTYPAVGRYTAIVTASNWVNMLTATTAISVDVPVGHPYVDESFEGQFPPPNWLRQVRQSGENNDDIGWETSELIAYSGQGSVLHADLFGMYDSWMVTPQVTPTIDSELIFWQYQQYAASYYRHGVWISTGRADPKYGDFVPLVEDLGPGTEGTWEEVRLALSAYVDQPIYIGFRYEGDFADIWYVDHVRVTTGLRAFNDGPATAGQTTELSATIGSGTNIRFTWDFGDGQLGSGRVTTHTYRTAGTYTATITASNSVNALTATTTVYVRGYTYLPLVIAEEAIPPCADAYEPDNTADDATLIATDGTSQTHNFHQPGDEDWVRFEVPDAAVDYAIETLALEGADTVIYLYDADKERLLDWNDDATPLTQASALDFNPYQAATFYLKIVNYDPEVGACDIGYAVRVTAQP